MAEGKQNREIAIDRWSATGHSAGIRGRRAGQAVVQENRHAATVFAIGFLRER